VREAEERSHDTARKRGGKAKLGRGRNRGKRNAKAHLADWHGQLAAASLTPFRSTSFAAVHATAFSAKSIRFAVVAIVALTSGARAAAQQTVRRSALPLELRVDAIDVRSTENGTLHAGLGANLPLGDYVRFEIDGAGGGTRINDVDGKSGRGDALARFLLDPFAETSLGLSIGGGMSATFGERLRPRQYLVVLADLEMPRIAGVVPALQVGLGGGVRVGLVARAGQPGRR